MNCPHCGKSIGERCSACGATVTESETVVTRDRRRVCLACAAGAVRQKREATRPAMPDPELQPAEWEAAWAASRRRQRS